KNAYVGIHFVPMKINYQELEELCKLAADMNVNELAILRFIPQGRGYKSRNLLRLNNKEAENLLNNIIKLKKKYRFVRLGCPIDFSFFSGNKNISKCKVGRDALTIGSDGIVALCPAFKYKQVVGNIKKFLKSGRLEMLLRKVGLNIHPFSWFLY
ncbi:unnamed protein product, partial [marine sediment metagenome]